MSVAHFVIISELFRFLNKANVPYCVLRNYKGLPKDFGRDIDMFVHPTKIKVFEQILCKLIQKHNYGVVMYIERYAFRSYYIRPKHSIDGKTVPIDVWTSMHWRGFSYINNEQILKDLRQHNGINVASAPVQTSITLLKRLLQYGFIRNKYKQKIFIETKNGSIFDILNPILGNVVTKKLIEKIVLNDWEAVSALVSVIKSQLITRSFLRKPIKQSIQILLYILGWFRQYRLQSGSFVCFIGPDGSGKTTLSSSLSKLNIVFSNVIYRHGRFGILPDMKVFFGKFQKNVNKNNLEYQLKKPLNIQNSMPKTEFSFLRALVYMLYYMIDFILGYIFIFYHRGIGNLVVFDRYYYDYMILWEYGKVPRFIFKVMFRIIPTPNMIIYPRCEAKMIFQRKPELSEREITRQIFLCNILSKMVPVFFINSGGNAENTTQEMFKELHKRQNRKYSWFNNFRTHDIIHEERYL